jgi:hypothetical protein
VQLAEALAGKDVVRQHDLGGLARAITDLDYEYPGIVTFLGAEDHQIFDTLDILDLMACFDVAVCRIRCATDSPTTRCCAPRYTAR